MKKSLPVLVALIALSLVSCASPTRKPEAKGPQIAFSRPAAMERPAHLKGFPPNAEVKDPYTGRIYTASPQGEIVIDK